MTTELVAQPVTPMTLIERASASGASIEQMQQLFELKLRVEADEARKSFNASMADFKRNPPRINKNKHVKFGGTEYDHATLDHVTDQITAALSAVGISHKWSIQQKEGKIIVGCILTHRDGHSETTTLESAADTSGSKNAIQAIASAVTYLQRYTLLSATGLAAFGTDNDGQSAGAPESLMADQEYLTAMENIENASTVSEVTRFYLAAIKAAGLAGDKKAIAQFEAAANKRKEELKG